MGTCLKTVMSAMSPENQRLVQMYCLLKAPLFCADPEMMEIVKTTMLIVLKWEVLCNQSTALPSSSHCRENTPKNNENMVAKHEHPKLLSKKLFFHPKDFFSGSTFYNSLRSSKFARIELKDLYKSRAFKALLMGDDYHGWSPPKRTPYRKQGFNSRPYWGKPMVKIRP